MSRRIEVELTSERPDGTWTWRQAGAREPKGVVDASVVPVGSKVGDVLRADAEQGVDGILITAFLAAKGAKREPERLELLAVEKPFEPVTSTLVGRAERDRGDRRDRRDRDGDRGPRGDRPRGDRPGGDRPRGDRPRGDRPGGDRPGGDRPRGDRPGGDRPRGDRPERGPRPDRPAGERRPRPERPAPEPKPKPKRLRPGRTHRQALLAELPDEQRPIAEQLLRGGLPAVRQALDEQNAALRAEGRPEVKAGGVLALAEQLLPRTRAADWRDRAEAALADVEELDLRDLRQVVTAAADAARDDEARELAAQVRAALNRRQDAEHAAWLTEIGATLDQGRAVRALRLASRPPKPGTLFPPELLARLAEAATTSLTAEATSERWVAVVEALAYAPVHGTVAPQSVPSPVPDEVQQAVRRLAGLVPQVARALGIEVTPSTRAPRPGRRPGSPGPAPARKPLPPKPPRAADAPAADTPVADTPVADTPAADTPAADAPAAADTPVADTPAADTPAADTPAADAPAADAAAGGSTVETA